MLLSILLPFANLHCAGACEFTNVIKVTSEINLNNSIILKQLSVLVCIIFDFHMNKYIKYANKFQFVVLVQRFLD